MTGIDVGYATAIIPTTTAALTTIADSVRLSLFTGPLRSRKVPLSQRSVRRWRAEGFDASRTQAVKEAAEASV
jgi:hypothetical protein